MKTTERQASEKVERLRQIGRRLEIQGRSGKFDTDFAMDLVEAGKALAALTRSSPVKVEEAEVDPDLVAAKELAEDALEHECRWTDNEVSLALGAIRYGRLAALAASPSSDPEVCRCSEAARAERIARRMGATFRPSALAVAVDELGSEAIAVAVSPSDEADVKRVARAIARGCNLDPDADSPRAAKNGHSIPEWMFFVPAARAALAAIPDPEVKLGGSNEDD